MRENNKKFCFICLTNLYLAPYISKYTNNIEEKYDIIYWNRHKIQEQSNAENKYAFEYEMEEGKNYFKKTVGYVKFKSYAEKIIKDNNYLGIIILGTSTGILLANSLIRYYPNKYIIDIRDYTMEKNRLYYYIESRLIKKSGLAVISSPGYKEFLPKHKYSICHNDINLNDDIINYFINKKGKLDGEKIEISLIGLIRFYNQNIKVIERFANDDKYILKFIGKNSNSLKEYCKKNNVQNVILIEQFPPNETINYYKSTNIINNLYGNNSNILNYALSNKLYYSAMLRLPILVCSGTYMEKIVKKYNIGYVVDLEDEKVNENLYNYYMQIDWEDFNYNCKRFLDDIKKDNDIFIDSISKFILQISQ